MSEEPKQAVGQPEDDVLLNIGIAAWEKHSRQPWSPDGLLMACVAVRDAVLSHAAPIAREAEQPAEEARGVDERALVALAVKHHLRFPMNRNLLQFASELLAAPAAVEGHFRRASEYGPWIECAHNDEGAVAMTRAAPAAAEAQPVRMGNQYTPERLKKHQDRMTARYAKMADAHSRQPQGASLMDEDGLPIARYSHRSHGMAAHPNGTWVRYADAQRSARASESRAEGLTFADGIDSAAEVIDRLAEQYAASKNEPAGRILEDLARSVRALAAQNGVA